MSEQDYEQLTLFQEVSPVSHLALPGSDEARRMTVISGQRCSELYRKSGPLGSLVRTLLGSSQWRSTRCFLTWKISATPAKRLLFRLAPSTPRTGGTDAQSSALMPTCQARDWKGPQGQSYKNKSMDLPQYVKTWPTPTAADAYTDRLKSSQQVGNSRHSLTLGRAVQMWPTPTARASKAPSNSKSRGGGQTFRQLLLCTRPQRPERGCAAGQGISINSRPWRPLAKSQRKNAEVWRRGMVAS